MFLNKRLYLLIISNLVFLNNLFCQSNHIKVDTFLASNFRWERHDAKPLVHNNYVYYYNLCLDVKNSNVTSYSEKLNEINSSEYKYFISRDQEGGFVKEIATNKYVAKFGNSFISNPIQTTLSNSNEILFVERNKISLNSLNENKVIWEKEYKRDIEFSFEFDKTIILFLSIERYVADKYEICLLDKKTGGIKWSVLSKESLSILQNMKKDDERVYFTTTDYENEKHLFKVKFFDLKNGSIHEVSLGDEIWRSKDKLIISNKSVNDSIYILDFNSNKMLYKHVIELEIMSAFEDKLICGDEKCSFIDMNTGQELASFWLEDWIKDEQDNEGEDESNFPDCGETINAISFYRVNKNKIVGFFSNGDLGGVFILSN